MPSTSGQLSLTKSRSCLLDFWTGSRLFGFGIIIHVSAIAPVMCLPSPLAFRCVPILSFASSDPYTQFPVVRPARRPKTISSKLFRPTYPQCISLLPIVKICWLVSMKIYQEIFHPIQKFHWSSHFHQVEISPATSTSILDSKIFC